MKRPEKPRKATNFVKIRLHYFCTILYSVFSSHMPNIVTELPKGHLSLLSILATKSRFENQVPSLMSTRPVLTPIEHMPASRLILPLRCLHVNVLLEDKLLRARKISLPFEPMRDFATIRTDKRLDFNFLHIFISFCRYTPKT